MQLSHVSQVLPIDHFASALREVCGRFNIRPAKGQAEVWGGVSLKQCMDLEIALVATDLQQIVRTSHNIRQDDNENHFLIIQQEGRAMMGQNDHYSVLHPGDMILIDSSRPSEFTFFGDRSCQLSVHLPRAELDERFGKIVPGGLSVNRRDPTAIAIRAIIAKSQLSENVDIHLKEALFSMIGVIMMERCIHANSARSRLEQREGSILTRAISYIDSRFYDPDFMPAMIAEDLGLQPYQIQRAFKLFGTTATRYLLTKRLEAARNLLTENAISKNPILISTIAYQCGFSDISYFNKRFKEVFGITPGACCQTMIDPPISGPERKAIS